MPSQARSHVRNTGSDQEAKDLCRLLSLINTAASKQQLPSIDHEDICDNKLDQWPVPQPQSGAHQQQSTEAATLEQFSFNYQNERNFSQHEQGKYFNEIFTSLIKKRLCCLGWTNSAPPENVLRVLRCIRIMMRDISYQKLFWELGGVKTLSEHLQKATNSYLSYGDTPRMVDILKEMSNIFQKLSAVIDQRDWLVACRAHKSLVLLLSASDVVVLHCSLYALISLAQSSQPRQLIGELNCIEILLRIIQEYDIVSKKLSANLLRLLCADSQSREKITEYDGVPILISQLHGDNVMLLWQVVWCLVQLSEDPDTSCDIRQMGGIPLLLALLHDRKFVSERSEASVEEAVNGSAAGRVGVGDDGMWDFISTPKETKSKGDNALELQYSLKSACCAALTELVLDDTNAQQIVEGNGIYSLGLLILPHKHTSKERKAAEILQTNAFRALRFLFSMERNRGLFKRIFPPELFVLFIDLGHYRKDLSCYKALVDGINQLSEDRVSDIHDAILDTNQNKAPSHYIGEYAVFELLGSGAFGSVYKVRKKTAGQSYLALKEINIQNQSFGKNAKERDQSVGEIVCELTIIKEQLKHPNIVRYCKTFIENDKLYIVMEKIEGAPLGEHFNSLKEKGETFEEGRIWNIFVQMVLALRYLHKEKRIVHRDLTPNNVMLGENDKVTITDFGLAKRKRTDCSKMTSVVGTILYSCPEIVQNQPYGEKADIWALGCILYQMCMLEPPFFSSNMLTLATKIVEADYHPVTEGLYSNRLVQTIQSCITALPDSRPDILQLSSQVVDIMLVHMDNVRIQQTGLERKLARERKRTQKHFIEANKSMQKYHRLFLASQERYDKLANLAGSGGASAIKDADIETVFCDPKSGSVSSSGTGNDEEAERGWSSDDDSYPSSGSESRGSSAGSRQSSAGRAPRRPGAVPQPPGLPKTRQGRKNRNTKDKMYSQLNLDIPAIAKYSRDSGIGSGDPSPSNLSMSPDTPSALDPAIANLMEMDLGASKGSFHRSQSTSAVDVLTNSRSKRPHSGTATLTISPHKVRQISDPILQLLHQLHKVIYISQLPPTLSPNPKRRMIDRYKRALFAPQSTSFSLKNELKKLMMGSRDIIDLNLGPLENPRRNRNSSAEKVSNPFNADSLVTSNYDPDYKDIGITYEQLQAMIESALKENGYYVTTQGRTQSAPHSSVSDNLSRQIGMFGT